MPKSVTRTYSRYTQQAIKLLGQLIRLRRIERKLSAQELAERAGVSRGLLQRIEKGDPKCEIGVAFELAALVDVRLFDSDLPSLGGHIKQVEDKLVLLPKHVRKTRAVEDEF